ncbi:FAS1 domain-containing protein [Ampelomyces quisqualis]|uniref:FAS1 domain-containing protein n=1 Tax=Ampelomyces quisqualis TaxID=50730 RepID=A0A6A5QZJ3_AMPQU|nr:FAS1 domain-containing protein [Ampelomyces quisqualis]
MLYKSISLLALAGQALAQNTPTLVQALNSSSDLSQLSAVLALNPQLVETLGSAQNITILAPSNAAFGKVDNATLGALTANPALLAATLQYHVLNGTVYGSQVTNTSAFVPTLLTDTQFTNVTGGQRVRAQLRNGNVTFYSGLNLNSTVSQANVNFTGGVIHVIDSLLTVPESAGDTLTAAGLTSLRGALNATNLLDTINNTPNITIFAPSNAALQAIGGSLASFSAQDQTNVLTYHAVVGAAPGYSSGLTNGTVLSTVNGANLTVTINQGRVFVNGARVTTPDVLIANGVVHCSRANYLRSVLNPSNGTIANPSATAGVVAFSGASSASAAPFTSGQPSASRTLATEPTQPAGGAAASSSTMSTGGVAQAMQTGSVGMGAILGAAAVFFL